MEPLNILISAYACRPGEGSEPGVGWHTIQEVAKYHNVWVLTRQNNRPTIEAQLNQNPIIKLQVIYCEPPSWLRPLHLKKKLVYLHYYLWQIAAYLVAKKLQETINFHIVHHVTYVRHSTPSFLALLPIPFLWGPVGGGESAPKAFWKDFGWRGIMYEIMRDIARTLGELDPFVKLTAQRSILARGTTAETTQRLRKLGAKNVEVLSQLGLSDLEITQLNQCGDSQPQGVKFISIGRLLHWKGFHLGLKAFAQAKFPPDAEYWIVGDGPERRRLETLVQNLGITNQVKFWNHLSRPETLKKLSECLALVHPSLHESGGLVCVEAMAAGRPVICLDWGGPGLIVTEKTGFKIPADQPQQAIDGLANAMTILANNSAVFDDYRLAGRQRVQEFYSWKVKGKLLNQTYEKMLEYK
ncbi:glycosyltransferase [Arthrospira platensis]|uniref:Glycosyl transferase n=1 Tax=Limnospira platensis NIES-46 TaxID=1236695 RepID=A0A5M3T540_LIMPL|nr:glycosyltransferase [Arthrospira platensis]AMW28504.1 glycosyl transferase family 1 [Arthrospira platensis YZ]KDR55584.1 glycosyl transferase family 1 [Arthrospira platensis str. Paraca]MBD2572323.1 glycosyltransferase [Arthrospira platensis FACHB-971]MBD2668676.1 glycosyltransferase [Arthrospira platensis FACHB-439]MBD2710101.1 glycosyltransferase [Arthrospira platensis FACHB-835]MDF2209715.1 glycosyltransferase [Arthrospira platensis NCB002]MDT9182981.1 glycosyltransferase [Limnospira s